MDGRVRISMMVRRRCTTNIDSDGVIVDNKRIRYPTEPIKARKGFLSANENALLAKVRLSLMTVSSQRNMHIDRRGG